MVMKYKILTLLILIVLCPKTTNANSYAWSESLGYFNFEDVTVTDSSLLGNAYNDNTGFLNMEGVINNGSGDLSGYAWSESVGYFDFNNVDISSGSFIGYAYNDNTGFLNMSGVTTPWTIPNNNSSTNNNSSNRQRGSNVRRKVKNLEDENKLEEANELRKKFPNVNYLNEPLENEERIFSNQPDLNSLIILLFELNIIPEDKLNQVLSLINNPSSEKSLLYRDLEIGSEGQDVKYLQSRLIYKGYSVPAGSTGYFGQQTQSALIQFQEDNNINPAAGYFGSITRSFIN